MIMKKRLPMMLAIVASAYVASPRLCAQQRFSPPQIENASAQPCVLVLGAVRSPRRIDIENTRLAEAISMAGGVTERASGTIHVIHSGNALKCFLPEGPALDLGPKNSPPSMDFYTLEGLPTGNVEGNPKLQPGDVVVVIEGLPVYVTGMVKKPQGLFLKEGMTLTE